MSNSSSVDHIDISFIVSSITSTTHFLVIAVDVFLIVIISRKGQHQVTTKGYVWHYAIFNMLALVIPMASRALLELAQLQEVFAGAGYCVVLKLESACVSLCHLFALGLGLDWVLTSSIKWGQLSKYCAPIIYTLGLLLLLVQTISCFSELDFGKYVGTTAVYCFVLMWVLCCDALEVRKCLTNEKSYALIMSNVMTLSWTPLYVYKILWNFSSRLDLAIVNDVLLMTSCIPYWVAYCSPIAVLMVLVKLDSDFRKSIPVPQLKNKTFSSLNVDIETATYI